MSSSFRRLSLLALFGVGLAGATPGQVVTEFQIPGANSGPDDIVAGRDGNLWFAEANGKIGRITPAGVITEFGEAPGSPSHIAAGPDGNLWFTEYYDSYIGRITTSGFINEYPIPTVAIDITAGPDGALWLAESSNRIGRIVPGGALQQFTIPFDCNPNGITTGPDGNLWFTGEHGDSIGRLTPGGEFTRFGIPSAGSGPVDITAGPDGNLWFTEGSGGRIGRITTDGHVDEFPLPASHQPGAIAAGADGNLWFTQVRRDGIGRITAAGEFSEVPLPVAGEARGITAGPDGNIWFTTTAGRIAPGSVSNCTADATTLCLNGGRFQVRADWQASSLGTSGHGNAVSLTGDTGTFWFFNADSVEIIVKVLDGCSLGGHSWVFAAGLTNVGVTLTVTDTQADETRIYTNAANTAFAPIQDTAAFSTCP
jgi:streptogramin lyase